MVEYEKAVHPFKPEWDERSRVLVLGTFPSVKSREDGFYYGHPRNRFWPVLAAVLGAPVPAGVAEKRALLRRGGVALWDVLERCDIAGSSDQSIRLPIPNDIAGLLRRAPIERVFLNGQKAGALYQRYCASLCGLPATVLPSTSPANASWSLERLAEAWRVLAPGRTG